RERAEGGPPADAGGVAHVGADVAADVGLLQRVDVEASGGPAGGGDVIDGKVAADAGKLRAQVGGIDAEEDEGAAVGVVDRHVAVDAELVELGELHAVAEDLLVVAVHVQEVGAARRHGFHGLVAGAAGDRQVADGDAGGGQVEGHHVVAASEVEVEVPVHALDGHGEGPAVNGRAGAGADPDHVGGGLANGEAAGAAVGEGQVAAYQAGGEVGRRQPAFQRLQGGAETERLVHGRP